VKKNDSYSRLNDMTSCGRTFYPCWN